MVFIRFLFDDIVETLKGVSRVYWAYFMLLIRGGVGNPHDIWGLYKQWEWFQFYMLGFCPLFMVISYISWEVKYRNLSSVMRVRHRKSPNYVVRYEDEILVKYIDRLIRLFEVVESWLALCQAWFSYLNRSEYGRDLFIQLISKTNTV